MVYRRSTAPGARGEREVGGGLPHGVVLGYERVVHGGGRVFDHVVRNGGQLVERAVHAEAGSGYPARYIDLDVTWGLLKSGHIRHDP